jgi:hypothetical protein
MPHLHILFLGVLFRLPTRRYYTAQARARRQIPLHLVLAATTAISSTNYLLDHITGLITGGRLHL